MTDPNVILVRQGVYMGSHGETVWEAIYVDPTEKVGDLIARTLVKPKHGEEARHLEIRLPGGDPR